MVNKWSNKLSETIFCVVPHRAPIVWLVIESNNVFYVILGNSIIRAQCILHLWVQSEAFKTSTISSWVFTVPCSLRPDLFVGFFLPLIFFRIFIVFVGLMVHVHYITFPFHIVLGALIQILAISGNIIFWFIYSPVFKLF